MSEVMIAPDNTFLIHNAFESALRKQEGDPDDSLDVNLKLSNIKTPCRLHYSPGDQVASVSLFPVTGNELEDLMSVPMGYISS